MDYQCAVNGCASACMGPPDFGGIAALAEVQNSFAVQTPTGVEWYCRDHVPHGRKRAAEIREAAPKRAPEPVSPPVAQAPEQVVSDHLYVVCQKDRIFGVFTDSEKADGIRRMCEALSDDPVVVQAWIPNDPGVQVMHDEEPVPLMTLATPTREKGRKRRGKAKRRKAQQHDEQEQAAEGQEALTGS